MLERVPLYEEVVTVNNSVVTLKSLLAGAAFKPGVNRCTVHNIDPSNNVEIRYLATGTPASGAMDVLVPDADKTLEWGAEKLAKVYVYAAAATKLNVLQEGLG
jgi:hypothetical protein